MNGSIVRRALFSSALLFAAVTPALSQVGPGPGPGNPGMMGRNGPGWNGPGTGWHMWGGQFGSWWGGGPDAMASRIDGRLAFLKAELKITDAQNAAWNKVADAVRASTKSMTDRMKGVFAQDQGSKTLPERLDVQEQFLTARLDEVKQLKAALKDLYAVLSDAQKKEADTLVLPMMGMGMMGWGPGPGMMWNR